MEAKSRTSESLLTADTLLLTARTHPGMTRQSDRLGWVGASSHGAGGKRCNPVVVSPAEMWNMLIKFFHLHKIIPKEETE